MMVWEIKLVIFGGKRGVTPAFGGSLEGMWAAGVQVGVRWWVSTPCGVEGMWAASVQM